MTNTSFDCPMSSNLSTMRPPILILIPTSLVSFHLHFSSSTCLKTQHLVSFLHTSLSGSLHPCSPVLGECCDTSRGLCGWCVAAARLLSLDPGPSLCRSCKLPPTLRSPEPEPVPALGVTTQSVQLLLSLHSILLYRCNMSGGRKPYRKTAYE